MITQSDWNQHHHHHPRTTTATFEHTSYIVKALKLYVQLSFKTGLSKHAVTMIKISSTMGPLLEPDTVS